MVNDCHIFVIWSAHHALAAKRIIELSNASARTVIITTLQSTGNFCGCEIIRLPPISSLREVAAEVVRRRRKKTLHDLLESISDDTAITLFVPTYQHQISNYLAFFLLSGPNLTRVLIPDGVLSYYQYRLVWRDFVKHLSYRITSIGIGLKYKMLWKSIDFPDDKNSAIYTYAPDCVYSESAEVIPIPFKKKRRTGEFL